MAQRGVVIDRIGQTFSRLTVIERAANQGRLTVWRCRCLCGNVIDVVATRLPNGNTRSCGCLKRENSKTHGLTYGREYHAWGAAISRCRPTSPYGVLGITFWPAWAESFEVFYAHIGPAPSDQHQIDRIDSAGHYEPGNVRWATPGEQGSNKRNNRRLTLSGETHVLAEWARRLNVPRERIQNRLKRGWSVERALTEPYVTDRSEICRRAAFARHKKEALCHVPISK